MFELCWATGSVAYDAAAYKVPWAVPPAERFSSGIALALDRVKSATGVSLNHEVDGALVAFWAGNEQFVFDQTTIEGEHFSPLVSATLIQGIRLAGLHEDLPIPGNSGEHPNTCTTT